MSLRGTPRRSAGSRNAASGAPACDVALADLAAGTALGGALPALAGCAVLLVALRIRSSPPSRSSSLRRRGAPHRARPAPIWPIEKAARCWRRRGDRRGGLDGAEPIAGLPTHRVALPVQFLDTPPAETRPPEWVMFTSGTSGSPKMVVHMLVGLTGDRRLPRRRARAGMGHFLRHPPLRRPADPAARAAGRRLAGDHRAGASRCRRPDAALRGSASPIRPARPPTTPRADDAGVRGAGMPGLRAAFRRDRRPAGAGCAGGRASRACRSAMPCLRLHRGRRRVRGTTASVLVASAAYAGRLGDQPVRCSTARCI